MRDCRRYPPESALNRQEREAAIFAFNSAERRGLPVHKCYKAAAQELLRILSPCAYEYAAQRAVRAVLDARFKRLFGLAKFSILVLFLSPDTVVAQQAGKACNLSVVATGGTQVAAVVGPVNGGYIRNPLSAADEGTAVAEPLFVNPVGNATTTGNGTTTSLQPGQPYNFIPTSPGQQGATYIISVNASTSGHAFECVRW